jgi:hypothetical protein
MDLIEIDFNGFTISMDKSRLDVDAIHEFLSTKAYWCLSIPKTTVETLVRSFDSIKNRLACPSFLFDSAC